MSSDGDTTTTLNAAGTGRGPMRFGAVGIFWLTLAGIWTAAVLGGVAFLFHHRHMSFLRIRGLPLSFAAITLLHLYWAAVQLVYTLGHWFPDGLEYWIMSIWLPFGIALFHASNSRFLHVASLQRRFVGAPGLGLSSKSAGGSWPWLGRLGRLEYSARMLVFVCIGMAIQVS
jgi:hypothetical protein